MNYLLKRLLPGFFLLVIFFLLAVPFYSGDVKNHLVWGKSIVELGPKRFYERDFPGFAFPNYPPLSMGLFASSVKLYQITNQLAWWLNLNFKIFPSSVIHFLQWENTEIAFLKLPAIIFHILTAWVVWLITRKRLASLLTLFNPALIYLSIIWGQIDIIPVFWLLLSIYLLFKDKKSSILPIFLALMSKQTIIIFLPLFFFIYLRRFRVRSVAASMLIMIGLFYLFYLPFHSFDLTWPVKLYRLNFELVAHSVSEQAFNLWSLVFGFDKRISDETPLMFGLTYQKIGYLAFFILMILPTWKLIRSKIDLKRSIEFIFLTTVIFFLFLTRMHERYPAPAVVALTTLAVLDKRYYFALLLVSLVYFINLYRDLLQPNIPILNYINSNYLILSLLIMVFALTSFYYCYLFTTQKIK